MSSDRVAVVESFRDLLADLGKVRGRIEETISRGESLIHELMLLKAAVDEQLAATSSARDKATAAVDDVRRHRDACDAVVRKCEQDLGELSSRCAESIRGLSAKSEADRQALAGDVQRVETAATQGIALVNATLVEVQNRQSLDMRAMRDELTTTRSALSSAVDVNSRRLDDLDARNAVHGVKLGQSEVAQAEARRHLRRHGWMLAGVVLWLVGTTVAVLMKYLQ